MAAIVLAVAVSCAASDEEPLRIAEPIMLEQLAMANPKRKPKPIQPEVGITFDANAGTYTRNVRAMSPVWSDSAPKAISGIDAFKANKSSTPSYSTPYYSIGEGRSAGFAGGEMTDWKDSVRRGPTLLIIIGGLMLAAGIVVAVWAGRIVLGLAVAGAGMALAMTGVLFEMYPWVVLIALAGVLGLAIWWFIDSKALVKTKTALTAVVGAVEANPAVKASVADAAASMNAESDVRSTIRKTKTSKAALAATKAAADAKLKTAMKIEE